MRALPLVCVLLHPLSAAAAATPPPEPPVVKVVVNAKHPGSEIERARLTAIFFKKVDKWDDGRPAVPVDQSMASETRARFSQAVLKQSILAVQHYWRQQIYNGRMAPPPVRSSDAEVLAFVEENPGGIGYVSAATDVGDRVKQLKVVD